MEVFSCGFEQSGFITELAIDIHRPSIETIQMNHKTLQVLGDIRKINPNKIIDLISNLEAKIVITAGVPCQVFQDLIEKEMMTMKEILFQRIFKVY